MVKLRHIKCEMIGQCIKGQHAFRCVKALRTSLGEVMHSSVNKNESRTFFGHPYPLGSLFFTEMWERFSFYGIRPLLILFMAATVYDGGMGLARENASAIVGSLPGPCTCRAAGRLAGG
jgi:POT family proton-dependent oligopeptide transporter